MENFYLYSFSCKQNELHSIPEVVQISGTNLVAVNTTFYNNKSKRMELSQSAKLLPFWITQELFLDIIEHARDFGFTLTKIEFYFEIEEGFLEMIETLIMHEDYKQLRRLVEEIKIYFDSNIKTISFDYKNKLIEITNRGAVCIDPLIKESFFSETFKRILFEIEKGVNH